MGREVYYNTIIDCLSAIGTERGWDTKAVTESQGLLKRITDATFIVCFQTAMYYYGYLNGLSRKLQGTALDLLQGYSMVDNIKNVLISARGNDAEYDNVYQKAEQMAEIADTELVIPRRCGRQTQRSNVPGDTPQDYFKRAVYLPYIDALIQEYSSRFNSLSQKAVKAMALIPAHLEQTNRDALDDLLEVYIDDLPMASSFQKEYNLWQRQWSSQTDKPTNIKDTLVDSRVCPLLFPNITKVLNLLLLTSVTASSVERANFSLRFVKNSVRSSMSEDRFNALVLLFVHKDIDIDIQAVLDMFARKYPRRMLLLNPLA
ncbi:52 kDa repressor of the inhibitor of the protein kinase-like [Mytilus edulis]|uniref:52 kDa repressor of the inhibitor of the protein kinase-like n=1 Tax=Mytilus edulis TaxID=6550 RepID=UPI0039F108FF